MARASASPRSAAIPGSRLISTARMESRALSLRRRRERRRKRRKLAIAAVWATLAAAFAAGLAWKVVTAKLAAKPPAPTASKENREEALRLVDEAIRAKQEGRHNGAMSAAAAARKTDPGVRGMDVLAGTVALEAAQPEAMRAAAENALHRRENEADALLLLALHKWMTRGTDAAARDSAAITDDLLARASEAEPSNMEVMFFWGDMASYAGREDLAHKRLLGGVHRQQPWLSSATLAAKMELAAEEASALQTEAQKSLPPPPTPLGKALVELHRAARSGADPAPRLAALRSACTEWQARQLLGDQAFRRPGIPPEIVSARNAPVFELPGGSIAPPSANDDATPPTSPSATRATR